MCVDDALLIHTRPTDVSVLTLRDFGQSRFTPTSFGGGDAAAGNRRGGRGGSFQLQI